MRVLALLSFALASCSEAPPAPTAGQALVPASLFATGHPPAAREVEDVKKTAKVGDEVVLAAQVGGRKQWQVDGKAMFFVVDPVLESCDEMEGDDCATPWDFCCVPKDQVTKKLATVRVLGADGQPLSGSIAGVRGLRPLAHVVVAGKVQSLEAGGLVLDAQRIWLR